LKQLYTFSIVIVLIILLASCAPGQMLGPTFTPIPTSTATPTATVTLTPTPTSTPTPSPTPTPSHPPYLAAPANYGNTSIPLIKRADLPALVAYLNSRPSHLQPNAPNVSLGNVVDQYGTKVFALICLPFSCVWVATVKLDDTETVDGVKQSIQPVIMILEVKTKDGHGWVSAYLYDPTENKYPQSYTPIFNSVLFDGTFIDRVDLGLTVKPSTEVAMQYPYFAGLYAQNKSAYDNSIALINQWWKTGVMDPSLWNLLYLGTNLR
jgi:hypothetical protein